jgi:polo-like kinase 1
MGNSNKTNEKNIGKNKSNLSEEPNSEYLDNRVKKYVDYSSKYGLGYLLYNGLYGVVFNDKSKIVLNPSTNYLLYLEGKKIDDQEIFFSCSMNNYPNSLKEKVSSLQYFIKYLEEDNSNNKNNIKEDKKGKKDKKFMKKKIIIKNWMKSK